MVLTISWVVDDLGEAIRSIALQIKGLDFDLKLSDLEIFLSGNKVGFLVNITPCLRV